MNNLPSGEYRIKHILKHIIRQLQKDQIINVVLFLIIPKRIFSLILKKGFHLMALLERIMPLQFARMKKIICFILFYNF